MNSAQTGKQSDEVCERFTSGGLDLLYVSPERLLAEPTLQMLRAAELALFAKKTLTKRIAYRSGGMIFAAIICTWANLPPYVSGRAKGWH